MTPDKIAELRRRLAEATNGGGWKRAAEEAAFAALPGLLDMVERGGACCALHAMKLAASRNDLREENERLVYALETWRNHYQIVLGSWDAEITRRQEACAERDALREEVERLEAGQFDALLDVTADRDAYRKEADLRRQGWLNMKEQIEAVKAERDALREPAALWESERQKAADAERFRALQSLQLEKAERSCKQLREENERLKATQLDALVAAQEEVERLREELDDQGPHVPSCPGACGGCR